MCRRALYPPGGATVWPAKKSNLLSGTERAFRCPYKTRAGKDTRGAHRRSRVQGVALHAENHSSGRGPEEGSSFLFSSLCSLTISPVSRSMNFPLSGPLSTSPVLASITFIVPMRIPEPGRISLVFGSSGQSVLCTLATSFTFPAIPSLSRCCAACSAASAVNLLKPSLVRSLRSLNMPSGRVWHGGSPIISNGRDRVRLTGLGSSGTLATLPASIGNGRL
jgi:hypothetical protein